MTCCHATQAQWTVTNARSCMCLPICRLLVPLHACTLLGVLQTGGYNCPCMPFKVYHEFRGLLSPPTGLMCRRGSAELHSCARRCRSASLAEKLSFCASQSSWQASWMTKQTRVSAEQSHLSTARRPAWQFLSSRLGGLVLSRSGSVHAQEGPTITHSHHCRAE